MDIPYDDRDLIALDAIVRRLVALGASMAWVTTFDGELLAICEAGEPGLSEPTTIARTRLPEVVVGAMVTSRVDLDAVASALEDVDRVFARYRGRPDQRSRRGPRVATAPQPGSGPDRPTARA